MKRDNDKCLSGYMTVEASLVMAVVMMVYLFIIRCMLFQYDRCILEQEIARLTVKYVDVNKNTLEEIRQLVNLRWDREVFLLLSPLPPKLELKGGYVAVTSVDDSDELSHDVQYKFWQMEPESFLRIQRKIQINQEQEEGKE